jgi:hypothetical protein
MERLRQLLTRSQPFPSAYIEETHFEHVAMLQKAFEKFGAANPKKLAETVVFGQREWSADSRLAITTPERSRELRPWLKHLNVADVVQAFDLGPRVPGELWRDGLVMELQQLVDCHSCSAESGHYLVLGST